MSQNTAYELGRVGLKLRGDYNAATAYETLDVVSYNGSCYAAKAACTGVVPTNEQSWMLLAKGAGFQSKNEEQATGATWLDGSPIYQKCFELPYIGPSSVYQIDLSSILGTDLCRNVVRVSGIGYGGTEQILPLPFSNTSNISYQVSINSGLMGPDYTRPALNVWTGSSVTLHGGHILVEYVRTTSGRYIVPYLKSNSDQGCVVSASSIYASQHDAWKAFDGLLNTHWASTNADTSRWIQIRMPHELRNITVGMTDTQYAESLNSVVSGTFFGSNNGTTWSEIGTFSNRPTQINNNTTRHEIGNAVGYNHLRIRITQSGSSDWAGFSRVLISGDIAD